MLIFLVVLFFLMGSDVTAEEIPAPVGDAFDSRIDSSISSNMESDAEFHDPKEIHGNLDHGLTLTETVEPEPSNGWLGWTGQPGRDSLLLGMWSLHTSKERDKRNGDQNLLGIQYKGIFLSTFNNSYYDQSVFFGFDRIVYSEDFLDIFRFDLGYKIGLIHGYGDRYPNLGGFSPFALPVLDISYKKLGVDFSIVPMDYPVFMVNFRINY